MEQLESRLELKKCQKVVGYVGEGLSLGTLVKNPCKEPQRTDRLVGCHQPTLETNRQRQGI